MLSTIVKILISLFFFGIIIFIHELGHFIAAKCTGVKVNEFALGMGPKLFSFGKKETVYSLRLLPIGGFCSMEGEDEGAPTPRAFGGNAEGEKVPLSPLDAPQEIVFDATVNEEGTDVPLFDDAGETAPVKERSFAKKKVWQRIIIVVAGAVMNLVLGFVLLFCQLQFCSLPNTEDGRVLYATNRVYGFHENAMSEQSGLKALDEIVKIDGKTIITDYDLSAILQSDKDGKFTFLVKREVDGKMQEVTLENVQFEIKTNSETGRQQLVYDFILVGEPQTVLTSLTQAAKTECSVALMIWRTLGSLFTGEYGLNELAGPVGTVGIITDVVGNAAEQADWQVGVGNILMLMAMLTVNVGVFNLLPIPALDGGRLIFLIFEGVFRRPVPQKYEGIVHLVGMVLLLLLMVVISFSDISKLIGGA